MNARNNNVSDLWTPHMEHMWRRDDPSGTVDGYLLREGLPRDLDGTPSHRLAAGWERHERAGIRYWWRIDGAEEEWRPAGIEPRRSGEHVGWHVQAVKMSVMRDRNLGPCPECARLLESAAASSEAA